ALFEGTEAVVLTLVPATGYSVGSPSSATGTIIDNDVGISVAATDATGTESTPAQDPIVFTVTRIGNISGSTTVTLTLSGTATVGSDYSVTGATQSGNTLTLQFPANAPSATVTVTPVDDTAIEAAETVILTVAAGTGYTPVAPTSATGTIADNDTPVISVNATDASGAEQGRDPIVFTVTRSGNTAVSTAATLAWSGAATLTTDYTVAAT